MWPTLLKAEDDLDLCHNVYSCKEIGHIAKHCSKKFFNYCKEGHIIKDCRVRP